MMKWANGKFGAGSRRPGRFYSIHLGQPNPTARARHYRRPERGQPRLNLETRGQNLIVYNLPYHRKLFPFDARQTDRATRANRGYRAPSSFTAGIPHTVARMLEPNNTRIPKIATAETPTSLCSPTRPVGTTGSSGTKPENAPHRATTNRGTSVIKGTPTRSKIPVTRETTATRKIHQADVNVCHDCTNSTGRLYVTGRNYKQRNLVDTGSDLFVFPRMLLPGLRERTDYTLYAANRTTIPTYEWNSRNMNLGLRHNFTWRFVILDVDHS